MEMRPAEEKQSKSLSLSPKNSEGTPYKIRILLWVNFQGTEFCQGNG